MDPVVPELILRLGSNMPRPSVTTSDPSLGRSASTSATTRNRKLWSFGLVLRKHSVLDRSRSNDFAAVKKVSSSPSAAAAAVSAASAATASAGPSSSSDHTTVNKCFCCGMVLSYPSSAHKYRCGRCNSTNIIIKEEQPHIKADSNPNLISSSHLQVLVDSCLAKTRDHTGPPKSLHEIFEPLSTYTRMAFGSIDCLTNSFLLRPSSKRVHSSSCNIDFAEVEKTFTLLTRLPTKRPLYNALSAASECLRRIHVYTLGDDPRSILWILVLLHIPFLSKLISSSTIETPKSMLDVPEIKILCYDILKRCVGLLVSASTTKSCAYLTSWLANTQSQDFQAQVELINLYITFHLRRLVNSTPSHSPRRSNTSPVERHAFPCRSNSNPGSDSAREYMASMKQNITENNTLYTQFFSGTGPSQSTAPSVRLRLPQYGRDWHIKSAATFLSILYTSNQMRADPLAVSYFYNSMVDCVHLTHDFDEWQVLKLDSQRQSLTRRGSMDVRHVIAYIHGGEQTTRPHMAYYFCQYPSLISLGGKISILEYEARRQMERRAEEAFINSLDKHIVIDVYMRMRIRRENIVQDSVRAIQENRDNLKKSLKIQFINEPGIDAGGLKKEWFLLLTKTLFSLLTGMFQNVEDSNVLWFAIDPIQGVDMYTLLGWVLGLALYNSNLLDLDFPLALYKLLVNQPLQFCDYQQVFPNCAAGLLKLKQVDAESLAAMDLTFEVSFSDLWGKVHNRELIPNGCNIIVDPSNVRQYIRLYWKFFMYDSIQPQIDALVAGFKEVVGGNALSLFLGQEIELLLCGSHERELDLETLKSVTKYGGWRIGEDASKLRLVTWFWEYMSETSPEQRRKFLTFVTGSDRIPANGIQNLPFRITLIQSRNERYLPLAHTCFNELALHNYSSKEILVDKLSWAVNGAAGFGIK